jgi:hypothetical protein
MTSAEEADEPKILKKKTFFIFFNEKEQTSA